MGKVGDSGVTKKPVPVPKKIDWVKAAILERKHAMKLEWSTIGLKAHVDPDYLRKLVSVKHTDDWNPETRREVCRVLGIQIKTVLSTIEDGDMQLK